MIQTTPLQTLAVLAALAAFSVFYNDVFVENLARHLPAKFRATSFEVVFGVFVTCVGVGVIFGLYVALLAVFIAGGALLIVGPFSGFPGGAIAAMLGGLGMMAAAIGLGALLSIVTIWIINGLIWFGRLHYQVIKPAIDPTA